VLSGFEESGRARRGYFVEGLGAAQFATGATIDRLRSFTRDAADSTPPNAITLAATDPANPWGAALPWPRAEASQEGVELTRGHRPGRKAGALVVLVDGALALYVERGGKTLLSFVEGEDQLAAAATSLAAVVRTGLGRLRIEQVDGASITGTPLAAALTDAGFSATPRGLSLRA
jgi:ATP-dependent Lhr-like helicase